MSRNTKGQIAIEGFTTLAVILFLYATLVFMTYSRDAQLGEKTALMDRRDACLAVQSSVSSVLASGNGTVFEFGLSSKDTAYISGNRAYVGVENAYACSLPAAVPDVNITSGTIRVSNLNGGVRVENA